jgi:phage replication initiation protein
MQQYRDDGFNAGGRTPTHSTVGDWIEDDQSIKVRAVYVGKMASAKLCRIYEKDK